jgi:hypothetical protein
MVPPDISAVRRAPLLPRSTPLTASWWISAPRRAPGGEALVEHGDNGPKPVAREIAIRPCLAAQLVEIVLAPLPCADFSHDLLRQHVQGSLGNVQTVEFAAPRAVEQRGAFDQIVAR